MMGREEMVLNVGRQDGSTDGVLRVVIKIEGEIIKEGRGVIGYLDGGREKIGERLEYTETIGYRDGMEYL